MKRLTLTLLGVAFAATLNAQVEDDWETKMKQSRESAQESFAKFRQKALDDYENFRQKANAEYAKFLEEAWKPFDSKPAEEIPWQPKPVVPNFTYDDPDPEPVPNPQPDPVPSPEPVKISELTPVPEPEPEPIPVPDPVVVPDFERSDEAAPVPIPAPRRKSEQIQFESVVADPKPISRPQPVEPIVPKPVPAAAAQTLNFYGSSFPFHLDKEETLHLKDISEKSVAQLWTQLSDSRYDNVIAECLQQREERNLCDWAYVKLTQSVAEKYCGAKTNEAVVMQMYLLTQSGYQTRIARADKRLTLLLGSVEKIYRYKYFQLDGLKFYIIDRSLENMQMNISNHAFPGEKPFSMTMTQPKLNVKKTEKRTIVSKRYPDVKITVETNRNLIDFFNDCPLSAQWNYYSKASMSDVLKESLYPGLRKAIEGKSELEAVDILLNFVQTGLSYATDGEQFGYERPLYPDETIFYPYCDCEDRSILFSCLVRELVGLDVVLLNYPGHLATAVHFNENVTGDYLTIDGKTYLICDPTFINGAPVGRCAKEFKAEKPKVVKI